MVSRSLIVVVACTALAAIACSQGDAPGRPAGADSPSTAPATPPPAQSPAAHAEPVPAERTPPPTDTAIKQALQPWRGDLDGMIERRYIRMLVTFSKTNYFLDRAEQHGITYEAGKLFEKFLNDRLKTRTIQVHISFIPVNRDRIFQALVEGRGDIAAANLTITPDRLQTVAFARPFLSDVREVAVTAQGQPPLQSVVDLAGREVHVRKSSASYQSLATLNESLKQSGREPVKIVEASELLEDEDVLEMVNAGLIPATIVDTHVADLWDQVFDNIQINRTVSVRDNGQIAWALRQNTPQLAEMVDAFVAANSKGSMNFNMLYRRYFKDTTFVSNAASESEQRRFREAVAFFRKYGDQYDVPWLLVGAQAYQESQIDQTRKSHVGAVGVMQIKPSTAEGSPINITNVDKSMEQNIHAGVKYLRFIVDRYFKDAPMDRLNRGLFAMAAYNAGPARVAELRRKAKDAGLDENKWFGNVEIIAAREIGRETVQYVSNIYKYYVSYTLLEQQLDARKRGREGLRRNNDGK